MLTENDVVKAVVTNLENNGWIIHGTCSTNEHGIDILAEKEGKKIAIEAKGGTSATLGTKRYGKQFTANQKRSHVAVALLTATQVVSKGEYNAGIAFPDDNEHLKLIKQILPALRTLNIQVFIVKTNQEVTQLTF